MKSPNPFSGGVDALSDADFALLVDDVETRRCRELVGAGTYDEAARKWRPRPRCPSCSYEGCASDGSTPAGHRAWSCGRCGRKFNSLTGTVFENAKRALWRWVVFIRLMCFNVQLDACAELCGISHQTAWEWRHRVMATVDGYQDRIVLGGKVLLALPQNQPNAPLYPAGGAPGSRPGALPHFGRPRYLGPPPRARSTAG